MSLSRPLFSFFLLDIQLPIVQKKLLNIEFEPGPLVSEVTALGVVISTIPGCRAPIVQLNRRCPTSYGPWFESHLAATFMLFVNSEKID